MRKLLLALFLIPLTAAAQTEAPKKANTIKVTGVTYEQAVTQLLDKGYLIDKSDKDIQYVQSYKASNKSNYTTKVIIRIKDSAAIITGILEDNTTMYFGAASTKFGPWPIANKGMSPMLKAWNELNSFALSFNKPVEYLTQ